MLVHQKVTTRPHDALRLLISVTDMALPSCWSLELDILVTLCFYLHTKIKENFLEFLNGCCDTYYVKDWVGIAQAV
jgi:hypothetical protein